MAKVLVDGTATIVKFAKWLDTPEFCQYFHQAAIGALSFDTSRQSAEKSGIGTK